MEVPHNALIFAVTRPRQQDKFAGWNISFTGKWDLRIKGSEKKTGQGRVGSVRRFFS